MSGPNPVHLVDEADAWDSVLVGLPPDSFALGFNTFNGTEYNHGPIEHSKAAFDFCSEVHVAGSIDDVDRRSLPAAGHGGGVDRDAALGFFGVKIGLGGALIDVTHAMGCAGIIEYPLGGCGFPGVDVRNDSDVTNGFDASLHQSGPKKKRQTDWESLFGAE